MRTSSGLSELPAVPCHLNSVVLAGALAILSALDMATTVVGDSLSKEIDKVLASLGEQLDLFRH